MPWYGSHAIPRPHAFASGDAAIADIVAEMESWNEIKAEYVQALK
jgi:hypothetical protein